MSVAGRASMSQRVAGSHATASPHGCELAAAAALLDRDGRSDRLKYGLCLLGGFLVDLLKDPGRCGVDDVLGLLEPKASQRPNFLDDLDLLVASGLKNDVELVLLLDLFSDRAATGRGRAGHRYRCRGLDVKGVFELLHEVRQLDQRHLLERVEQVC